MRSFILLSGLIASVGLLAVPSEASFHIMQIEQVIGGVSGSTSVQAIQLRTRTTGQNFVSLSRLVAWDANGQNPVVLITPPSDVSNAGTGVRILIATSNFHNFTSPPAQPDFILSNLIPASYLAAGSLTFEDFTGAIVYWRLSWGGASYTGSNAGSTTNDADGNFGPPFGAALPSANTSALLFNKIATALSTNNAADYGLTAGAAVFTNNAGSTFTVQSVPTGIPDVTSATQLLQNFPNPFGPETHFGFTTATSGRATVRIYDARGALVTTLVDDHLPPGPHEAAWDGRDSNGRRVATGVYFYRLTADGNVQTRRMVLLK